MIPCGKCLGCKAAKSLEWAIRIYHESTQHERSCFVTLTYAESPTTLQVKDTQLFIKRLRKQINVRYFLTGEYGEKTHRPHYHAILFGTDLLGGSYPIDHQLYGSEILNRLWTHGDCSISEFTMATACYVAGYVTKKLDDADTFSTMSKNPPIGYSWALRNQDMLRRRELIVINGDEYPVPSPYLQWSACSEFRKEALDLDSVSANRKGHARHFTPAELRQKELNHKAQQERKKEKL